MKVLYIAAECKPFSQAGGVGDVAGELPIALLKEGINIEIVTPLYSSIDNFYVGGRKEDYCVDFHGKKELVEVLQGDLDGVPVNFIRNVKYFGGEYSKPYVNSDDVPYKDDALRFSFFSEACLELIKRKNPDIVHINDWVLGYLFGRMAMERMPQKRVLTIHNISYQGNIWKGFIKGWNIEKILQNENVGYFFKDPHEAWNSINPLRLGLELSHIANTVSPTYAMEMTQAENPERYFEGGKGLELICKRMYGEGRLIGILNGCHYNSGTSQEDFAKVLGKKCEMKKALSRNFENCEAFLLGFSGRAVEQKFKLLAEPLEGKSVLEHILDFPGINVALLASGLPDYELFIESAKKKRGIPRRNYYCTVTFDKVLGQQITCGSDVLLMPSLFEPCGITQMEALGNATPPIVRWTGGLVDTVVPYTEDNGTGFGFEGQNNEDILYNLLDNVKKAFELYTYNKVRFQKIRRNGFSQRFEWSTSAKKYIEEMYESALRLRI